MTKIIEDNIYSELISALQRETDFFINNVLDYKTQYELECYLKQIATNYQRQEDYDIKIVPDYLNKCLNVSIIPLNYKAFLDWQITDFTKNYYYWDFENNKAVFDEDKWNKDNEYTIN